MVLEALVQDSRNHQPSLAFDSIAKFISSVGVPAAALFFVLWQMQGSLDRVRESVALVDKQLITVSDACVVRSTRSPGG